jgi:hypothetical protein
VLTKESIEAVLGGFSIRLVYTYAVYRAVYTCVVLDRNGRGYIQLVYTLDMRLYILTPSFSKSRSSIRYSYYKYMLYICNPITY